ncbi:MAG: rane-associated protein [Actinobacteria bacterium]|jgi:membrane-associated protein|nr:rane-associated protein [Actinomycetota bacterium]
MNLFDAHSIVSDLGLAGILGIIFAETGLLIGLAFPGDSLLFIAGVAASGSGAEILGDAQLSAVALFVGAPIAAITGGLVGYFFGEKYGRKFFDRPDGRFFNHQKVLTTEKWIRKYGIGKALIFARFVPFVRTLINPMCGVIGVDKKKFFFYNALGALIWTQGVIGLGFILGEKLEGSVDAYLLPIIGLIVFISLIPVLIEIFREWQTRKHHK